MSRMPHAPLPPPVSSQAIVGAVARLFDRGTRVVGWGTGSVFDYFHSHHPVRLDYLVDGDSRRWGSRRHGVEVLPPARLRQEVPSRLLVIVYSGAWPEILAALATFGDVVGVPASALFADTAARGRLRHAEAVAAAPRPARAPSPARAIVVQGPILPDMTPLVLRTLGALHPRELIVLSTWRKTEPALLASLEGLYDELVLTDTPSTPGIQNRNLQIVSTRAGIQAAMACGARTIVKTRTDLAILGGHLFERARWLRERTSGAAARRAGLHGQLVVPSTFTRKYLLYHPSDLVMLGAAEDLLRYWSAPLDPRGGSLLDQEWLDRSLADLALAGNPAESYLGTEFCRAIGRPLPGTLRDSWSFYGDLLAVVDDAWFDLLWVKHLSSPDAAVRSGPRQTVSHAFWERLRHADPTLVEDLTAVDPRSVRLASLTGLAA